MPLVDHIVLLKLPQRAFGCRALGDAVIATDAPEYSLPEDFHRHANSSAVSQFFGFSVNEKDDRYDIRRNFLLRTTYPNLAVSGSSSSSSLIGDFGTEQLNCSISGPIIL